MPFILALLGALAGLAFWWHRAKDVGNAAHEVADTVGRVRGKMRRNAIRRKAEASPVTAIRNPVDAAGTIILAILSDGRSLPGMAQRETTQKALQEIAGWEGAKEAAIFASWAVKEMQGDTLAIISGATEILNENLMESEKHQLVFLLDAAVKTVEKPQNYQYLLDKLANALGIEIARQTESTF